MINSALAPNYCHPAGLRDEEVGTPAREILPQPLPDFSFRILTLRNMVEQLIDNETKPEAFFTLFVGIHWPDTKFRREDRPFAKLYMNSGLTGYPN